MKINLAVIFSLVMSLSFLLSGAHAEKETCNDKMDISDVRFSVTGNVYTAVSFGDIGCAVISRSSLCAREQAAFDETAEARDYYSNKPVRMSEALFVVGSGIRTPLGYGICAFANRESAERFITDRGQGNILSFDELIELDLD